MVADVLAPLFEVRLFRDSLALLEALVPEQPEVLVLDWHLPEVSGLDVLRVVRQRYDEVTLPVLILTGSTRSGDDLLEALEAGANDFATKPFVNAELKARVSTLARVRLLHDRARQAERRHERALREIQERADFEQQLVGIVSHDLRTPVGAIALGAAMLTGDASLTAQQSKIVERIITSSSRASRMICDLLDFTAIRLGQGLPTRPAAANLHEVVEKVRVEVATAHPDRELDVRHDGDGSGAWDADRIAQVVTNLATNALHYSAVGSPVTIETGGDEKTVFVAVRNGGRPIDAAILPRLFLPMQRGTLEPKSARRSVGLGLFIVESIVRAHHGRVEVRSTESAGTTFKVHLPRWVVAQEAADALPEG
jgi:signal transduction histidine kinase